MQGFFNSPKSIKVIHHIIEVKNENHVIISIDAEKALDTIQHPFPEKHAREWASRGITSIYEDPYMGNPILKDEKLKTLLPRSGIRRGDPLSPLLFNITLEVLAMATREEKEIEGLQIGKEDVNLSLFAGDMIVYLEDLKDTTGRLIELINEFGKVSGYKINTDTSAAFPNTNNERSEGEIRETISLTIASKSKIPRNKST